MMLTNVIAAFTMNPEKTGKYHLTKLGHFDISNINQVHLCHKHLQCVLLQQLQLSEFNLWTLKPIWNLTHKLDLLLPSSLPSSCALNWGPFTACYCSFIIHPLPGRTDFWHKRLSEL